MKSTVSKLKERKKRLRFLPVESEPTPEQIRLFYILNFIDMSFSYHATSSRPAIKEGNFLLPDKPTLAEFVVHKSITAPVAADNLDRNQMVIINTALTLIILNNLRLYEQAPKCSSYNRHVDGYAMPC